MTSFKKAFVTGCDANTEWMLPWFMRRYKQFNKLPIMFADFGISEEAMKYVDEHFDLIINMKTVVDKGWFKKPKTMINASKHSEYTCWIDTDFEILDELESIFNYVEPHRIAMVEDKPWTKRRSPNLPYYNSGIVAFHECPQILHQWAWHVENNPQVGDQETLHAMWDSPLSQRIYITDVPNEYNWLRLQLEHDNQNSSRKKAIHWTGQKGKDRIKGMIK
tara:strand:+ start:970 stop:1629 length:660 start_codon:yes stop_codon:yes gene_type:complete